MHHTVVGIESRLHTAPFDSKDTSNVLCVEYSDRYPRSNLERALHCWSAVDESSKSFRYSHIGMNVSCAEIHADRKLDLDIVGACR